MLISPPVHDANTSAETASNKAVKNFLMSSSLWILCFYYNLICCTFIGLSYLKIVKSFFYKNFASKIPSKVFCIKLCNTDKIKAGNSKYSFENTQASSYSLNSSSSINSDRFLNFYLKLIAYKKSADLRSFYQKSALEFVFAIKKVSI